MSEHTIPLANRLGNIHISSESYLLYKDMREWLVKHNVVHKWQWYNTGRYFPDYIVIMEPESAIAFKLIYNV